MFQFPRFAPDAYAFSVRYPEGWVAPFRNPKITARLPAPLGLSQVTTSFIASRHQDIRRVPLYLVTNQSPCFTFASHVDRLSPQRSFQGPTPIPFACAIRDSELSCAHVMINLLLSLQQLRSPDRETPEQPQSMTRRPETCRDHILPYPVVKDPR